MTAKGATSWEKSQDDLLRVLWDQGLSITEIGKRLGVSRSAVSGRKMRMGLSPRKAPKAIVATQEDEKKRPRPKVRPGRRPYELRNDPPPRSRCPWIIGDPKTDRVNAFYCSDPVTTAPDRSTGRIVQSTYCAHHHKMAYTTPAQAEARAKEIKGKLKKRKSVLGM